MTGRPRTGTRPIRAGIGGWIFPPWRGAFYPVGLPQARELDYASRHVTTIEINATFYGSQKPESFRRWAAETPDHFVFSVKAPRVATHRRALAEAAPTIERFFASGVLELGEKLGPILWQFPPTRRFDAEAFETFLALLPSERQGTTLRHAVEVRDASFCDPAFPALLRRFGVAWAFVDSDKHALAGDVTADFVYARLQRTEEAEPTGYPATALDLWADRFRRWAGGEPVTELALADSLHKPRRRVRDCFVYFISGAKVRAPAAAMALLERLPA
ncbi:MAG: DUF72 domain-containing protein [Acidisphaera sp.]|nr:DUF72 domain-containing protein [Acidisphaera sp.]